MGVIKKRNLCPRAVLRNQGDFMAEELKRQGPNWEKEVIEKLAFSALREQTRARRWGLFFKALTFVYFLWLLVLISPVQMKNSATFSEKHTAVVKISGTIMEDEAAKAESVIKGLRKAFDNEKTVGIILKINSPGGSPVQAGYIYDEIRRLRNKYPNKKVYAVAGDMCASAAYYIASAADEIYADKASIVGSIGVLMNGFGFSGAMSKLGVDRRLITAGDKKGLLDPFSPVKAEDLKLVHVMLDTVHQQFINSVKQGRGKRLKEDPDIFSGLFWTGEQALKLGLVDGLGSPESVARDVIGVETLKDYTVEENWTERLAKRMGASIGSAFSSTAGLVPKLF